MSRHCWKGFEGHGVKDDGHGATVMENSWT